MYIYSKHNIVEQKPNNQKKSNNANANKLILYRQPKYLYN